MISPAELTPGTLVCLDARSGIQYRHQRLMPWFHVIGSRRTVRPESWSYVWLTGMELDAVGRPVTQVGWTFLRLDGVTLVALAESALEV